MRSLRGNVSVGVDEIWKERTDVEDLSSVRIDHAVEVERVSVEMLVGCEPAFSTGSKK